MAPKVPMRKIWNQCRTVRGSLSSLCLPRLGWIPVICVWNTTYSSWMSYNKDLPVSQLSATSRLTSCDMANCWSWGAWLQELTAGSECHAFTSVSKCMRNLWACNLWPVQMHPRPWCLNGKHLLSRPSCQMLSKSVLEWYIVCHGLQSRLEFPASLTTPRKWSQSLANGDRRTPGVHRVVCMASKIDIVRCHEIWWQFWLLFDPVIGFLGLLREFVVFDEKLKRKGFLTSGKGSYTSICAYTIA